MLVVFVELHFPHHRTYPVHCPDPLIVDLGRLLMKESQGPRLAPSMIASLVSSQVGSDHHTSLGDRSVISMSSLSDSSAATPADAFTLYDLRVDAICPLGARILCGAKPGDHFFLEGEMLRMGEGTRGFSIYSMGTHLALPMPSN